jgi:NosR/NirI family nitrous oxide reductase transcriptional regulator
VVTEVSYNSASTVDCCFWLTRFLSLGQILGWFSTGINWKAQLFIGIVFILSVTLPMFFGKAFYCTWVCPYGAAQELCGKVTSKKIKVSPQARKNLNNTRETIFFTIMIIFWTGFIFDVSLVEPFAAFSIIKTGYFTLGIAGLFLVISLFVPKAWCNYFCPTGYVLEWIRK